MNKDRIEELQEKLHEFILNESVFEDDHPSWGEVLEAQIEAESKWDETDEGKELKALLDEKEPVDVIFRKFPDGDVIALISVYSCRSGLMMSYQHVGQHGEASVDLIDELDVCTDDEIKALLDELESIGYLVTVDKSHDYDDSYGYADQKNFD